MVGFDSVLRTGTEGEKGKLTIVSYGMEIMRGSEGCYGEVKWTIMMSNCERCGV